MAGPAGCIAGTPESVGQAAHRKVLATLDRQQERILEFFPGADRAMSP
jgi:hypothetical protein